MAGLEKAADAEVAEAHECEHNLLDPFRLLVDRFGLTVRDP